MRTIGTNAAQEIVETGAAILFDRLGEGHRINAVCRVVEAFNPLRRQGRAQRAASQERQPGVRARVGHGGCQQMGR